MHMPDNGFTRFNSSIEQYSLPEHFTFPYYYQPHPLCILASQELQQHLSTQNDWQHNFGLSGDSHEAGTGKMFGVLLVSNEAGEIGYLSAFSGKIADQNLLPNFVPPVFDMLADGSFFPPEQAVINQLTTELTDIENNPEFIKLTTALNLHNEQTLSVIEQHRAVMIENRKQRKAQRILGKQDLSPDDFSVLEISLNQQSINDKNQLRDLKENAELQTAQLTAKLGLFEHEIITLKERRATLSHNLQHKLFQHYRFLNIDGATQDLNDLFKNTVTPTPPAGAGECAAPKLLQHAFKYGFTPLALAEFWWGVSPKSEVRQHKNFYAACQGKCQPILTHMLDGMTLDENPLLQNPGAGKSIDIIYQDDVMAIINKPAEFLSVPGKNIEDSVYFRMKQQFPNATGPLIVHRLDMSTSGLMVIALTKRVHKNLQKQFINRTVNKRYIALLPNVNLADQGQIELPLRLDFEDRPRQLVCHEHGKPAETRWEVKSRENNQVRVYLYPKTGRTHQLRVHCAHIHGLSTPIIGDDLYGIKADRLHLHAEQLELDHPTSRERMTFQVDPSF